MGTPRNVHLWELTHLCAAEGHVVVSGIGQARGDPTGAFGHRHVPKEASQEPGRPSGFL